MIEKKYIEIIKTVIYLIKTPCVISALQKQNSNFAADIINVFLRSDYLSRDQDLKIIGEQFWYDFFDSLPDIIGDTPEEMPACS